MARIAGLEFDEKIRLEYALTRIKGIGWNLAGKILKKLEFNSDIRIKDLKSDDLAKITNELDSYLVEGDLQRKVKSDIQRLKEIGTYRGIRHQRGLPSRGQRTKTNARTKRGKRKTVGAFKKEMLTKIQSNKKEEGK